MNAHVVIDTVAHVAPFGLGLWDTAAGTLVSEGVDVRVWATSTRGPHSPITAAPNRAGIFVAQNFASLRAFEAGTGDADFWSSPPAVSRPYLVEVRDTRGRFTSFVMSVELPASRGLLVPACVSALAVPPAIPATRPRAQPAYVPLYSSASRPVPPGMAAVRTQLRNDETGAPAEHAVLEVLESASGRLLGRGIADARGEVAAVFAYPEPPDAPASSTLFSPPSSPPVGAWSGESGPAQQVWDLEVRFFYGRNLRTECPDRARPPLADLCAVIAQPRTSITSPPSTPSSVTLLYGEELVLRVNRRATLYIHPG